LTYCCNIAITLIDPERGGKLGPKKTGYLPSLNSRVPGMAPGA
jgi:hypothetical protein